VDKDQLKMYTFKSNIGSIEISPSGDVLLTLDVLAWGSVKDKQCLEVLVYQFMANTGKSEAKYLPSELLYIFSMELKIVTKIEVTDVQLGVPVDIMDAKISSTVTVSPFIQENAFINLDSALQTTTVVVAKNFSEIVLDSVDEKKPSILLSLQKPAPLTINRVLHFSSLNPYKM
jgi:hypothetical protein